ncbi:uncharacterized protein LOC101862066 [Aplysia californica]|uniref:Uncharacterized protein LOC101862066 n=1 Tax=Aplysia californica TaxID=6500 RepID=A0ABM1A9E0_APLCA|nr:uncharacterized protein LOC101862066 [Aplysia californica]
MSVPISLSAMFLDWQSDFRVPRANTAAILSTCVGVMFAAGVIPGYLMNRFGARFTVLLGTFLATTGCFLSAFATSVPYLIASTGVLSGLGFCFLQLPVLPCLTAGVTEGKSVLIALSSVGGALMNMAMPYLYRIWVDAYSWRGAFFLISGLSLNTLVTGLVMTSPVYATTPSSSALVEADDAEKALLNASDDHELKENGVKSSKSKRGTAHTGSDTKPNRASSQDENCGQGDYVDTDSRGLVEGFELASSTEKGWEMNEARQEPKILTKERSSVDERLPVTPLIRQRDLDDFQNLADFHATQSLESLDNITSRCDDLLEEEKSSLVGAQTDEQEHMNTMMSYYPEKNNPFEGDTEEIVQQSQKRRENDSDQKSGSHDLDLERSGKPTGDLQDDSVEKGSHLKHIVSNSQNHYDEGAKKSPVSENVEPATQTLPLLHDTEVAYGNELYQKEPHRSASPDNKTRSERFSPSILIRRLRLSKWKFMVDPLFVLFVANVGFGLGSFFSFFIMLVDFAKTKGFDGDKEGIFFIFLVVTTSLFARIIAGFVNLHPACHSVLIMVGFSALTSFTFLILAHVTRYYAVVCVLAVTGLGLGGVLGIFLKVPLDIPSVGTESYALALGVISTVEGIFDVSVPVILGYAVDQTGSYLVPLTALGWISLASAIALAAVFRISQRRTSISRGATPLVMSEGRSREATPPVMSERRSLEATPTVMSERRSLEATPPVMSEEGSPVPDSSTKPVKGDEIDDVSVVDSRNITPMADSTNHVCA